MAADGGHDFVICVKYHVSTRLSIKETSAKRCQNAVFIFEGEITVMTQCNSRALQVIILFACINLSFA